MPTGGSSGEYQALYDSSSYNTYDNYRAALHLPLSGFFDGTAYAQAYEGFFWSSTRPNYSPLMTILNLDASVISLGISGTREYGYSVRCLLDS